jgi:hypothetical protein
MNLQVKCLSRIRARMGAFNVDKGLLERSAAARAGHRVIQLAVIVRAIEPMLVLVATVLLMTVPGFAQQPGGNFFGQNDQATGTGVREAIRWGRNLLFLMGVGGIGWGSVNYMTEKSWGRQMLGGGLAMGIGGILSLIYSFSQGNAVNLDTDLN